MDIFFLAGGLGTRLRNVVDVPKPLAPVKGRPFLTYLFDYLIKEGASRFVISIGYRAEVFETILGRAYQGIPIQYVVEETPLGTGGGLLQARHVLKDDFILVNGDTFLEVSLVDLQNARKSLPGTSVVMALRYLQNLDRYGPVRLDENHQILEFLPKGEIKTGGFINAGVFLMSPRIFSVCEHLSVPCNLESDLLTAVIASDQKVVGLPCDGQFLDIGVPEDYYKAEKILNEKNVHLI